MDQNEQVLRKMRGLPWSQQRLSPLRYPISKGDGIPQRDLDPFRLDEGRK